MEGRLYFVMYIRYKILASNMVVFLALLTVFVPMSLYYVETVSIAIPILRGMKMLLLGYITMQYIQKKKIPVRIFRIALLAVSLAVSTVLNEGSFVNYVDNVSSILLVVAIIDRYVLVQDVYAQSQTIRCIFYYFFIMLVINGISIIFMPEGLYRVVYEKNVWNELSYPVYFLQTQNRMISFVLPLCVVALISHGRKVINRGLFLASLVVAISTILFSGALTAMAGIVSFYGAMWLLTHKRVRRKDIAYFIVAFFIFQIIFEIVMTQPKILMLIEYIFGRVDTIISRFSIGLRAKEVFLSHPIWGIGTGESGRLFAEGHVQYWVHNHSWDILIQGGIITYSLYINNLLPSKHDRMKNRQVLSYDSGIVWAALLALVVMGNTESFIYAMEFYFILTFSGIE